MIDDSLFDVAPEIDLFIDLTDEEKREVDESARQEIERHRHSKKYHPVPEEQGFILDDDGW